VHPLTLQVFSFVQAGVAPESILIQPELNVVMVVWLSGFCGSMV